MDVVVLSRDPSLFEATRHAVGERNPVWRARTAEESVELLLTGQCGVLLVDLAAVSTQPATLIEQVVEQFPDVVVVVAGRREDESQLARLISDGLVFRFMHKPLSPKRAGMFLDAAIRSHVERRDGRLPEPLLPLVGGIRARIDLRKWLFVTAGLAAFLLLLNALFVERSEPPPTPTARPAPDTRRVPAAPPLADPVLSGARAALAAGRYEAPAGRNSLDLFAAVLLARPNHPEARAGLTATTRQLVTLADDAARRGDVDEARRLIGRVLAVDPGHVETRALQARLDAPPPVPSPPPPPLTQLPAPRPALTPPVPAPVDAPRPTIVESRPAAGPLPKEQSARPVQVMPDPLTPTIRPAGPRPLVTTTNFRTRRQTGPPVSVGHPTAGYETRSLVTESNAPAAVPEPPATGGFASTPQGRDLEPMIVVDPVYPAEALRGQVAGWVEVEFTVTESGDVRDVDVVDSQPVGVFEAAATAAVSQWRYRPRVVGGRPVAQRTSVTLRFDVAD